MEIIKASSSISFSRIPIKLLINPSHFRLNPSLSPSIYTRNTRKLKLFSSSLSSPNNASINPVTRTSQQIETETEPGKDEVEKFDWYAHWYPVAPVWDLDKKVPHGLKVIGLDIVVWWDKNEGKWQVFEDSCPHRMAPLSQGRIDQWGRLQCVYHGWCFNGAGDCKFIPQAPPDGPPVHTSKKACATSYPSIEQNKIVWFWPSTDPQFKDIARKKKPPYFAELDDPSFTTRMGTREIPFGYEVLIENLMDTSHVPYAHYGIMNLPSDKSRPKADREGGTPLKIELQTLDINGFLAKEESGYSKFIPPCVFIAFPYSAVPTEEASRSMKQNQDVMYFICVPVSPGNSRFIWAFPRNFALWIDLVVPRWAFHVWQNLVLDSDLALLHLEEYKLIEAGPMNWQKACFLPTKTDGLVVAFRKWLKKYSSGQVDWRGKFSNVLPPSPPKEQLMDRYRSHVVNCSSCSKAVKDLKALEVALQVISLASVGILAAIKPGILSMAAKATMVFMAVFCLMASKWLSHFIYQSFYFHDYNHALV